MSSDNQHNKNTKSIPGWDVGAPQSFSKFDNFERVNLNPDSFDRLIEQHGVRLKVFRSMYCPRVKSIDGGEHEIDCEICNGSGFVDLKPVCTSGFIQNQNLNHLPKAEGFVDHNSVAISFPIGIELQYFTKVELVDFTDIYFQRIARSAGSIDVLKYKASRINVVLDENGIEHHQGNDFKLDVNGDILWKSGKGPETETIYSIHYEAAVQYRATRALHVNRFEQVIREGKAFHVKFPEQWICTKEFLVRREDINGMELLPNPIPHYNEETPEELG